MLKSQDTHWDSEKMPAHTVSLEKIHLKGTVFYFTNNLFPSSTKEWKVYFIIKNVTKPEIFDLQVLGFFSVRKKTYLNKILHLCSEKAEYLNNCRLPQPAVVQGELSSRHLGLLCFNQKKEHLTIRKYLVCLGIWNIFTESEEQRHWVKNRLVLLG